MGFGLPKIAYMFSFIEITTTTVTTPTTTTAAPVCDEFNGMNDAYIVPPDAVTINGEIPPQDLADSLRYGYFLNRKENGTCGLSLLQKIAITNLKLYRYLTYAFGVLKGTDVNYVNKIY